MRKQHTSSEYLLQWHWSRGDKNSGAIEPRPEEQSCDVLNFTDYHILFQDYLQHIILEGDEKVVWDVHSAPIHQL